MAGQNNDSREYRTEIHQAQGPVIGDHAHVEQHFYPAPLSPFPASRDELLSTIRQAGAELRAYPNTIAGIHIERDEVTQIVDWALSAEPKDRLGMLLDQPGSGKTVVMRDVLERLESDGVPVLAITADSLSGVNSRSALADRLGLPAPVEDCVRHLATDGPLIVLLDQLDALSLALSRDQATLDVMLTTLARLRDLDGVRIVASCRTFDLNNDPRLSQISVDRRFRLQSLSVEQVNRVLHAIGVEPARLLPAHQALLTVPLHLNVYARIVAGDTPGRTFESYRTLQELYEALWQRRIETVPPDRPSPSERIAVVYQLVEGMQANRQLTVPVAVLDEHLEAASYLERVGFVRREGSNWLFFHQTLFDYCYARRFVAQGRSLSQEILGGPQGLFERSQMVQVLAYMRGADAEAYRRELTVLLFADELRIHLRLLLIGWFGSLPDPTTEELRIAHRLIGDADKRIQFLQAVNGNEGWFDLLNDEVIPSLFRSDDERFLDFLSTYLGTLIHQRTDTVLARLRPYLERGEAWDARIAFSLSRLDDWRNEEAVDVLCDLLRRNRTAGWESRCLHMLAGSNPAAGCRALRCYLDRRLDDLLAQEQAERESSSAEADLSAAYRIGVPDRFAWNQRLFGEYTVGELMEQAVQHCPEAVVEHLLLWFLRAVLVLTEFTDEREDYFWDPLFAGGWYGEYLQESVVFARRMARALGHVAQTQPETFRAIADKLAAVESLAVQRVLIQAYLAAPGTYADDIFQYLTTDARRLDIGESLESPHHDSCRLYGAAFQYANAEQRAALEELILSYQPDWERRSLRHRGLTQLRFLKSVPWDLLGEQPRDRLGQLERKFPGFEPRPPRGVVGGVVGAPIEQAAQAKMSDEAWLGAMRKYDDSTAWDAPREDFLKGGVIELSRAFAEQIKNNPERFYRLAQRFDETISPHYVKEAISGLAESGAPAEWVFDLVRQFASRIKGEFRRGVCWALGKRAAASVPDDLLDLMSDWALHDPDPVEELWRTPASSGEPYHGGDPHSHGINTNRGAAIETLCRCALARTPPEVERAFQLLEQAADDPSTAVRSCVVDRLGPLLQHDDARALAVFERTLDGHPRLLQTPLVHRFLYWTYSRHFPRIRPFIEALLADTDDATRQAGARLACLAAFRYPEAGDLAEQIMRGDVMVRRGAAQIHARNLEHPDLEAVCLEKLLLLMHDPDERVRGHVGECFRHLHPEHVDRLQSFIEQFLASPALVDGAERLIKYLVSLAPDVPDLALMATERILDVAGSDVTDMRKAAAILERDLVRLPLAVYTHAVRPAEKSQAMDLFEHLLVLGSREAHRALSDWDGKVYPVLTVLAHKKDLSRVEQETIKSERTIEALKRKLQGIVREENPRIWAQMATELATAYRRHSWDERADNIEQAIHYYHQALEVLSREETPFEWATTQANLATAYRERVGDNRAENIEQAIFHYHQALEVLSREESPLEWATTQANLAAAYRGRSGGDRASNIEQAITYYERALGALNKEENPFAWAGIQADLAAAYRERIEGSRSANLESALAHQRLALEVFTDSWKIAEAEDVGRQVYQFFGLFSKLCGFLLQSYHNLIAKDLYLSIFDLSSAFQDHPLQFVDKFPVLFLATDSLSDDHLDRLQQKLRDHIGPSNRRALLLSSCDDQVFSDVRSLIDGAIKQVHAYDIICLSRQDLERVVTSMEPRKALRRLILLRVDLISISSYSPSGPASREMFFGREHELQEICDHAALINFILIGGRLIGKTSILKQLERVRLRGTGFYALYHECSYTPTQAELVQALVADKVWFPAPPRALSSLAEVIQALPDKKPLVILLDEADKLIGPDRNAGYPIFNTLRASSIADRCRFVLCGERALRAELSDPHSPLYNFGKEMLIGRLERQAVAELVTRPMRQLEVTLADEAAMVQRIWDFTSGHPSIVQSLCQRLIERLGQRGDRVLTLEDVGAIVADPDFLRRGFLNVYWERATALERLCSLVMAADEEVCTLIGVHEALSKHSVQSTLNEVDDALERLVDLRNILQRTAEGYEFAVTAFPEVIAKTHRLDDLIALDRETYQHHGDVEPRSRRGAL